MKQVTFHSIAYYTKSESTGHFYHYHQFVQRALAPCVHTAFVYVPIDASFVKEPAHWKKWFHAFYNRKNRKKFWKDCVRLFRQPAAGPRIFFLDFFERRTFSLYSLAALLFAKKQDRLWVLYRDDLTIRRKKELRMIYLYSKLLKWKYKDRFVPLTDNTFLADYYGSWFGKKPTVLPVLYAKSKPVSGFDTEKKLVCSWLGNPRLDKGATEIAQLVEIEDAMSSRVELYLSGATFFPPVKNQLDVRLRKIFLTEQEYCEALDQSDIVLLPYDPKQYKWRTSGVFVEAILAGKMPIVKEGSWLAYELKRFDLHELVVEWGKPGFFTHLFSLIQSETILKKLEKMQEAYQNFHGEPNFSKSLQELVV